MKKAVVTGIHQIGLADVETPRPIENWALVKIHVAPMCTEYKAFLAGRTGRGIGHEAAGEVVEIAQPGRVNVGDRVVVMPQYPCGRCQLCVSGEYIHCQNTYDFAAFTGSADGCHTYAQYILKPDWLLPLILDDVSFELASLACCGLGPTFGAMERMALDAFDTVLITGAGPVGLGGVVNAKYRGARVIAVESVPFRVERAKALGADAVLDPRDPDIVARIMGLTGGLGVDKAVDCSGVVAAHRVCIDATRRRGQVAFVGECHDETPIRISPDLIRKGISLHGSWHYNVSLYAKIMKVIQESPTVGQLISHTYPMSRVQQAMETCASQACAKVLLHPWE